MLCHGGLDVRFKGLPLFSLKTPEPKAVLDNEMLQSHDLQMICAASSSFSTVEGLAVPLSLLQKAGRSI